MLRNSSPPVAMSTARLLRLGFGVLVTSLLIFGLVVLGLLRGQMRDLDRLIASRQPIAAAIYDMQQSFAAVSLGVLQHLEIPDGSRREAVRRGAAAFETALATYASLASSQSESGLAGDAATRFPAYLALAEDVMDGAFDLERQSNSVADGFATCEGGAFGTRASTDPLARLRLAVAELGTWLGHYRTTHDPQHEARLAAAAWLAAGSLAELRETTEVAPGTSERLRACRRALDEVQRLVQLYQEQRAAIDRFHVARHDLAELLDGSLRTAAHEQLARARAAAAGTSRRVRYALVGLLLTASAIAVFTALRVGRGVLAIEDDLRDREQALSLADRRKDELLATLAHELRNPLTALRNAQALLHHQIDTAAPAPSLAIMDRQLAILTRLVDDLLDTARIRSGKIALEPRLLRLEALIAAAVETSRPTIEARHHHLALEVPARDVYLWGDPIRLAQAVANVLTNAARFTAPGGEITVSAAETAGDGEDGTVGGVRLSVRDNGVGIAAELLPRIFDMFVQGAPGGADGGMGIGLGLAQRLVSLHRGRVTLHSEGPDKGTEVVIWLPTVDPPAEAEPGQPAQPSSPPERHRAVLVVDDNRDAADSLAALLRHHGHSVRVTYDARGAEAVATRERFDSVLLDLGLPDLTGYELAQRLRATSGCASAHLIAVSGWGTEDDIRRSHDAGCDHHLVKPVDPDRLLRLLDHAGRAPDNGAN